VVFADINDGFGGNSQVPNWRQNWVPPDINDGFGGNSQVPESRINWIPPISQDPMPPSFYRQSLHEKPTISTKIAASKLYQFVDGITDEKFIKDYRKQISDNLDENQKLDLKSELLNLVHISLCNRQYEVFDKLVELMLHKGFSSEQLSSFRDEHCNNIALVLMDAFDGLCQGYFYLYERAEFENLSSEQMEEQEVDLSIALGNLVERIYRASEKPKIADLQKVIAQAQKSDPFNSLEEDQRDVVRRLHSSLQKIKLLNMLQPNLNLKDPLRVIGETFEPYLIQAA
jgi:hypothetical protein